MLRDIGQPNPIVGALQPGYLPWAGFFDQVFHADLFILYDDLEYTRKSWRNRNRVKGPRGPLWLTVPVLAAPGRKIREVRIDDRGGWRDRHWRTLEHCYARAPHFSRYRETFREIYRQGWESLCDLDVRLIEALLDAFGIRTPVVRASRLGLEQGFQRTRPADHVATRRVVHFMQALGANRFLEGQAGRNYLREDLLRDAGIAVGYQAYVHRPYAQRFGPFVPHLSAVDLLFNCGPCSLEFLVNPSPFSSGPGNAGA